MKLDNHLDPLTALSPLDGRYGKAMGALRDVFSECALIRFRVQVEIVWLEALCDEDGVTEAAALSDEDRKFLHAIVDTFDETEARAVKDIEARTNHDVKAVEYYVKNRLKGSSLEDRLEFVHFACTSEDINNLAHALMLKEGREVLLEVQRELIDRLAERAGQYADCPMPAHTHGQPATPTTVGKELAVFQDRLSRAATVLVHVPLKGKINGAVGNYNAHVVAYPDVDWPALSRRVVEDRLGLEFNPMTVQIEPHDYMAELFDALKRWNTVVIDLDRDVWNYISLGFFKQKTVEGEVGSSTMPHKVNPIDFENSEGNAGLARALLVHLSDKLPISRMQRDLTDSTVLRNMGVAFGYSLLACRSTLKGLGKVEVDETRLKQVLDRQWEVLAEAVQTIMRKNGIPNPYEKMKALTRGRSITADDMRSFIDSLDLPAADAQRLRNLTPATYTGLAGTLARMK